MTSVISVYVIRAATVVLVAVFLLLLMRDEGAADDLNHLVAHLVHFLLDLLPVVAHQRRVRVLAGLLVLLLDRREHPPHWLISTQVPTVRAPAGPDGRGAGQVRAGLRDAGPSHLTSVDFGRWIRVPISTACPSAVVAGGQSGSFG